MIAKCVAILVFYHNGERTRAARTGMVADVQVVADEVASLDLKMSETDERILRPVETELFARYGHEVGSRMNTEFLMAFEGFGTHARMPASEPNAIKTSRFYGALDCSTQCNNGS